MKKLSLSNFAPHNSSILSNTELNIIQGGDNERLGSGQETIYSTTPDISYFYIS